MESVAWKLKIPVDRAGTFLNFDLKELGIDEFMAVQSFVEKKKFKEAVMLFFHSTVVGGDSVDKLRDELDKNNIIPFSAAQKYMLELTEPVPGELKKN